MNNKSLRVLFLYYYYIIYVKMKTLGQNHKRSDYQEVTCHTNTNTEVK